MVLKENTDASNLILHCFIKQQIHFRFTKLDFQEVVIEKATVFVSLKLF